jgi:hypothetical protein
MLAARAEGFTAYRKESQPGGASTGSMFKNPENFYAGYLIETAGLKGFQWVMQSSRRSTPTSSSTKAKQQPKTSGC